MFVPTRTRSNQPQAVGQFGSVAEWTVERRSEPGITPSGIQDPLSKQERWAMTNVLAMPARELRYPVAHFVLVVAGNRSLHEFSVPRRPDRALRQEWPTGTAVR